MVLPPGKAIWRAQLGHDVEEREVHGDTYEEPIPFKAVRMKPLRHSAFEGRVNPRGIPCLYGSNVKETAVAEVRPWVGSLVSLARLKITKELRLVNCGDDEGIEHEIFFEEPPAEERAKVVWRSISRAFSSPVGPDLGVAEYAPTQVLAEHFKSLGYDGVVFKSSLGPGFNVALFDLDAAQVIDVRLVPVKTVRYEIGEARSSYVVKHESKDA